MTRWAGFDVGGQAVKAVLADRNGQVHAHGRRPTGLDCDADRLGTAINELLDEFSAVHPVAQGIGVGIAGVMGVDGILHGSPNLPKLVGTCVREDLVRSVGRPLTVDNDASCAAFGEGLGGAGSGVDDYVLVTLGSGVGSGLVIGGRVYHGATGYGCELGHTIIERNGRLCGCGNRGFLEAYVSESATRSIIKERGGALANAVARSVEEDAAGHTEALFALADRGDAEAPTLIAEMIEALGCGLASAVNLLDVTTVILGGGIAPGVLARRTQLEEAIAASLFARPIGEITLLATVRGSDAGALGAARLAMPSE